MKIRRNTIKLLRHYHQSQNSDALLRSSSRLQVESPNSIVARVYTARALVMNAQYRQASEIYESILIPFPRLGKIYVEYLDTLWIGQQRSVFEIQALRFLEFHFSAKICFRLGRWLMLQKQWSSALQCFLRLRAEREGLLNQNAESKLKSTLGKIYFHLGNYREAISELDAVDTAVANYYRARIFADQGRLGMALQQLEKIDHVEMSKNALSMICQLQRDLDMREAEQSTLYRLFKIELDRLKRLKILDRLEWISESLKDQESLLKVLKMKSRLGVQGPREIKKIASVFWNQEKMSEACKVYEKLLELSPFDEEALVRLTSHYRLTGNRKRAYQFLKTCYLSGQATPGAQIEYAECSLSMDRISEGRDVLLNLLEKGFENPRVYFLLWKIYANQGKQTAAEYYKKLFDNFRAA